MALKCLGNCVTCEHLSNGEVDEVICPVRVSMIYMKSVDAKVSKVLAMLESADTKPEKQVKSALVIVGSEEEEETLKEKEEKDEKDEK